MDRDDLIEDVTARMVSAGLSLSDGRTPAEIADRYLEQQALDAARARERAEADLEQQAIGRLDADRTLELTARARIEADAAAIEAAGARESAELEAQAQQQAVIDAIAEISREAS